MLMRSPVIIILAATALLSFATNVLKADRFDSPSLDFQGNEIKNAALSNVSFQGSIQHLAVSSLEIQSESSNRSSGIRLAVIDHRGGLTANSHFKFDDAKHILQIDSNVDLNSRTLKNFQVEKGTILHDVTFQGGSIHDAMLTNATFENPTMHVGSITVDDITVTKFQNDYDSSSFLVSDNDGRPRTSRTIQECSDGTIQIHSKLTFEDTVDFANNTVSNVNIESGQIKGDEIDVIGRNIQAESFTLLPYLRSKRHYSDSFVMIDANGNLRASDMTLEGGRMQDAQIEGSFHFRSTDKQGRIINPAIEGGTMKSIEELVVEGGVEFKSDLKVREDVLVDGSLTVGGSVLGSGPYVDVSDARLKTNVTKIEMNDIVDKLQHLQAVSYNLVQDTANVENRGATRSEIGFIAQDVQEHFPELVSLRPDGYLGIQYARFVPLITEAMKDVNNRLRVLEEENKVLREMMEVFFQKCEKDSIISSI